MSIIFLIFLICKHGILFCSFRPSMFISIALWSVLGLFVGFFSGETMFGSHRSLLAWDFGLLLVFFWLKCGVVYLEALTLKHKQTKTYTLTPKEREEIKRTTKQKMARRQNKEGENHWDGEKHLEQESNKQKTLEGTDSGLHPTVDEQSLGKR